MDYIREEFQRQAYALEWLLSGNSEEKRKKLAMENQPDAHLEKRGSQTGDSAENLRNKWMFDREISAVPKDHGQWNFMERTAKSERGVPEGELPDQEMARQISEEFSELRGMERQRFYEKTPESKQMERLHFYGELPEFRQMERQRFYGETPESLRIDRTMMIRQDPEIRAAAREVSMTVQRDARRYDGGFSMY